MPQDKMNKSRPRTKIITAVLIAGFVMTAALLYWYNRSDESTPQSALATKSETAAKAVEGNVHEKEVVDAQKTAALAAIPSKPVSDTPTQRPDFVSEIEWQVLQKVANNQPDSNGKKLTDLVNKLLFNKKREAWLAAGENTAQRRELARQLLDMIPEQLESEAIDSETAKEMETKLSAELR